jgi:hypothetical protein
MLSICLIGASGSYANSLEYKSGVPEDVEIKLSDAILVKIVEGLHPTPGD